MDLSTFPVAGNTRAQLVQPLSIPANIRGAENQPLQRGQSLRQSGMGVASLVLAIISILNMGLLRAVVAVIHATFPQNGAMETPYHYLLGGWTLAIALIAVAGIVFGIGGLRQQNRRHSFATVGLCLNIAIPMCVMFFLLLKSSSDSMAEQESADAPAKVAADDPPAWRSPAAITLQCATIGMAAALITYSWKRRNGTQTQLETHADLIACEVCRKQLPHSSKFCRRCGHALAARPSTPATRTITATKALSQSPRQFAHR